MRLIFRALIRNFLSVALLDYISIFTVKDCMLIVTFFKNWLIHYLVENCSNMVIIDVYEHDIEYKESVFYLEWSMWVL